METAMTKANIRSCLGGRLKHYLLVLRTASVLGVINSSPSHTLGLIIASSVNT